MTHPFYLRLPYVAKLDNQIEPGQSLIVRGQSTNDTFVINLATSSSIEDCKDLVLHVSIQVKKGTIVFNSLSNGQWGKEEVHKCPLEKGQDFSVRIRSHPDKFEVFLKGKSLGSFDYRQPISTISHVQILGDLVLNAVGWEGNYYSTPYQVKIPGNFTRTRKLFLTFVPDDSDSISVNFLAGDDDIAFHFNPRFFKKHTVNNSFFGGKWGNEEVVKEFPFSRKKAVDLMFVCENDQFGVYVDGKPYCTFVHRVDPNKIDGLKLDGSMELQVVNFE